MALSNKRKKDLPKSPRVFRRLIKAEDRKELPHQLAEMEDSRRRSQENRRFVLDTSGFVPELFRERSGLLDDLYID